MSSYGHPQADGYDGYDSYGQYEDTYAADSYGADPYPDDSYSRGSGRASVRATASVAAAPTGRARVSPPTDRPRPRYDWSRGSGSAGVAAVPVSPGGPATGRATVRPGGPGMPAGPAGTGPGGEGRPAKKKKRHWFRNTVLIMLAVTVISAGGGMVALSYYVESVPPPDALDLPEGSTIFYGDGSRMATLAEYNREIIDFSVDELATVRNAVIAVEDPRYFEHSGIDFGAVVRAGFNNTFGSGPESGASTISMQYTRAAAGLTEDSYERKFKEMAMAYKLEEKYSKMEILGFYLNQVYMGRGSYGFQAAAKAYFGKPAVELSASEAAMLAGIIRYPASSDNETGLSVYDPLYNPDDQSAAIERWSYALDAMVETGALDPAERATMTELPEVTEPPSANEPLKSRNGHVIQQVKYELAEMGITDVETGGYRITTTIDKALQDAAMDAARSPQYSREPADYWQGIPEDVDSSLVSIDPATGGVLAYYGGNNDGTDFDHAGPMLNEETGEWSGGWPPGSTMKIYTLIAELREGISFSSHWDSCPDTGSRGQCEYRVDYLDEPIRNAGRGPTDCEGEGANFCSLRAATRASLNIPFYQFSEAVPDHQGPARILQAAKDAGIMGMTDVNPESSKYHDLTASDDMSEFAPSFFDHQIAFGQYPITTLHHANGVATLANRGVYNEAHFVESVEQKNPETGEWEPIAGSQIDGQQLVLAEHADAITDVLTAVPGLNNVPLEGGRPAAAKTGTWEHPRGGNADAWVVGYTPQIATAVWVGDDKREPIVDGNGSPISSDGLPAFIWKRFMDTAHAAKNYDPAQFTPANPVGRPDHEWATGVEPNDDDDCRFPFLGCDDDDNDGGDGEDNRGRGGNNDNDGDNDGEIVIPPPTTLPEPDQ
jgi:membrane peptidoglycan carboxypeptidase